MKIYEDKVAELKVNRTWIKEEEFQDVLDKITSTREWVANMTSEQEKLNDLTVEPVLKTTDIIKKMKNLKKLYNKVANIKKPKTIKKKKAKKEKKEEEEEGDFNDKDESDEKKEEEEKKTDDL